ncbi:IclR family transcriptional regulator [Pandoraea eparura]|uniref:IclR family transcriptional regulator n=1 Tax=Pandoraea eparura TaxID=2508291 RepID=A0A5E4RGJ7_9BURK|nr:IclR family transcriptional regulator [Pandoraea eparura]VVD61078.1 IclR family transcriptional regulator [Pandoraea eparura]
MDKDSPMFNQSVDKGLAILAAFGARNRQMSLAQIAEAVGITRSSAQRIVFTLDTLGYVTKDPYTRRYELANKVMEIGCNYVAANPLIESANPFLSAMNSTCDETVALTEPCGTNMVYVASFTSRKPIVAHMAIGSRMPMYCTSAGRAYLAGLPDEEARALLRESEIKALTPATLLDPETILTHVVESRARGFSMNFEEYMLGHMNVGAPVYNKHGRAIAAVHVVAPSSRWTRDDVTGKLGAMVRECAGAITNAVRAH